MGIGENLRIAIEKHSDEKDVAWLFLIYLASLVFWLLLLVAVVKSAKESIMGVLSLLIVGGIVVIVLVMFILPRKFLRGANRFIKFFFVRPFLGTLILIAPYILINSVALCSGIWDVPSLLLLNGLSTATLYVWHNVRMKMIDDYLIERVRQ